MQKTKKRIDEYDNLWSCAGPIPKDSEISGNLKVMTGRVDYLTQKNNDLKEATQQIIWFRINHF
jgi:hypothetical protein